MRFKWLKSEWVPLLIQYINIMHRVSVAIYHVITCHTPTQALLLPTLYCLMCSALFSVTPCVLFCFSFPLLCFTSVHYSSMCNWYERYYPEEKSSDAGACSPPPPYCGDPCEILACFFIYIKYLDATARSPSHVTVKVNESADM